jgi:hypothetical protein
MPRVVTSAAGLLHLNEQSSVDPATKSHECQFQTKCIAAKSVAIRCHPVSKRPSLFGVAGGGLRRGGTFLERNVGPSARAALVVGIDDAQRFLSTGYPQER